MLIASYPRSGSNWVGRTLEHALLARIGWADPLERGRRGIYHDLDRFLAQRRLDELERWGASASLILKTHRAPESLERDAPGWLDRVDLVVGVVRPPLDVMASVLRYLAWSGSLVGPDGEVVKDMRRARELGLVTPFVEGFIDARGHAPFEALGFGSWVSHARAWSPMLDRRGLRLRYEDITRDSHAVFASVLDRLTLPVEPERLDEAIASATPERIGAQFGAGFVNNDRDDAGGAWLTPEQLERAHAAFGEEAARYGLGVGLSPRAR